jgi:hypothetical protein
MSDTFTTNLALTLPAIGASQDSWGGKLNANFSTLDDKLGGHKSLTYPGGWRINVDGTIENWGYVTTNTLGVALFHHGQALTTVLVATLAANGSSQGNYTASFGPITTTTATVYSYLNGAPAVCGVWVRILGK